jgi:hypothetical protein
MSGFLVVFDFGTGIAQGVAQPSESVLHVTDCPTVGVENLHVTVPPDE